MINRKEVDLLVTYWGISEEVAYLIVEMQQSIRELEDRIVLLERGPVNDDF